MSTIRKVFMRFRIFYTPFGGGGGGGKEKWKDREVANHVNDVNVEWVF